MPNLNWENAKYLMENPSIILNGCGNLGIRLNQRFHSFYDHSGVDIVVKDWDNLLIIDGCRFDDFQRVFKGSELKGDLQQIKSKGSDSYEFTMGNFLNKDLSDTILVTSNPFVTEIPRKTFFDIKNLLDTHWNQNYGTVLPEDVSNEIINTVNEYPNKRVIGHFMQPHYPFIGSQRSSISGSGLKKETDDGSGSMRTVWGQLRWGINDFTIEEVRQAYLENIEIVTNVIADLLQEINGKTVLSSDHGNLFGERTSPLPVRGYGHPRNLYVPQLVEVPWLEFPLQTGRREIKKSSPISQGSLSSKDVEDKLKSLGYR